MPEQDGKNVSAVTPSALRKRRQRERDREQAQIFYQREDWQLFLDPATLCQKAGCYPSELTKIVLKELTDNGLDTGALTTLKFLPASSECVIADTGPGLDPKDVPVIFAVNRPLRSTKLKRLLLRGMLGNGLRVVLGAVSALEGRITVNTCGHR
jgi:hypothetical protein